VEEVSGSRDSRKARRDELIARSDAHRAEIERCLSVWKRPLERADRAMELAKGLKRHAPWIAAGIAALWVARGKAPAMGEIAGAPNATSWLHRARTLLNSVRAVRSAIAEARETEPRADS
jgi:hypothetical protein